MEVVVLLQEAGIPYRQEECDQIFTSKCFYVVRAGQSNKYTEALF